MTKYRNQEEKRQLCKKLGLGVAILVIGLGIIIGVLRVADGKSVKTQKESQDSDCIVYDGKTYVAKGNLETYLFAGIDAEGKVEPIISYDGTGQCDVLMVLVRDRDNDECKTVTIDRNTITPIRSLEDDGTYISTDDFQISLAHAMSLDHTIRAENTVDAVSTLLGDVKIDAYAMVNMSAIQIANDLVGGITVTIEDDFTGVEDSLKMGETITLQGEQAEHYIRGRKYMKDDDSNENRMARQECYKEGFKKAFQAKCSEDKSFPLDFYHALEDYMTTTISAKKFSRLAQLLADDKEDESLTIEGSYGLDDSEWQTFTPDQDSLQKVILELFYEEK